MVGDNQPGDVQSNVIGDFFPFCIQFSAESSEVFWFQLLITIQSQQVKQVILIPISNLFLCEKKNKIPFLQNLFLKRISLMPF